MLIHFTTVHPRGDTRIRVKEVTTLAQHFDTEVVLFVQDGLGDEQCEGYTIVDTGRRASRRLARMTFGAFRMFLAILRARPAIAHFHDPELVPWAILLRISGIKIIYDVHEDLPNQLRHKAYLAPSVANVLSRLVKLMEWVASQTLTHFVVVVPSMINKFNDKATTLLANFPLMSEFPAAAPGMEDRLPGRFVYVGGITGARGISEMLKAIEMVDDERVQLQLLGTFSEPDLRPKMEMMAGWGRVEFLGLSEREVVVDQLGNASAGLVLLHPTPQYVISYPVKMFEYMAAGLPVIASDFPLWREIVGQANCGLLVDPQDPRAIADAMEWIIEHPSEAALMGRRGRAAVEAQYNWEAESKKLITLYENLLT